MTRFTVETERRTHAVDVTDRVEAALPPDADGTATVFVRHTTAAVTVNEAESNLLGDVESFLSSVATGGRRGETVGSTDRPVDDGGWDHDRLDGNADSHLRALLVGPSVTVPVEDGRLDLGTWQSVLLVECDGPRSRTVAVRAGSGR